MLTFFLLHLLIVFLLILFYILFIFSDAPRRLQFSDAGGVVLVQKYTLTFRRGTFVCVAARC